MLAGEFSQPLEFEYEWKTLASGHRGVRMCLCVVLESSWAPGASSYCVCTICFATSLPDSSPTCSATAAAVEETTSFSFTEAPRRYVFIRKLHDRMVNCQKM